MPLANGSTFADFTIVRLLGTGSISEDYVVDSPRLKSRAVLRVLSRDASNEAPRFERDIALAKTLRQPKIVEVYDSGVFDERPWVLVEFVPGPDAGRLVRERFPDGMPAAGVSVIVADVADALDYAHAHGLTHGNVTPAAILIAEPFSLLSGFGLSGLASTGETDQAGLAATAVQLLTGSPRFDRSQLPFGETRPDLASFDPVLAKARALAPAYQYPTCRDFAIALAGCIPSRDAVAAPAPVVDAPRPPTKRGPSRRTTVLSTVLAVIAIAAVVFAGVYVIRHHNSADVATQASAPSAQATASASPVPPPGPPACGVGDALLAQMSDRDKLAQLLMVGVTGADDARSVVTNQHVGGIMVGSWTDLTMMGAPLKEIAALGSPLPLAVSTDEEGGRVSRLKSLIGKQPSARELVQSGQTSEQVYQTALTRGKAMKDLGITVDFAPVADVSDQGEDTVIGDRSFSNDPAVVAEYAGAYARGLREAGVLPVFKHFPGHGHASGDSHLGGVTTPPLEQLKADDLVPYTQLLKEMPDAAVMVGHMQVPGLTGTDPASLTPAAYQLLREGTPYGGVPFNGVVFTDDISSMGAINQNYTVAQAALKALKAGADIALWITTDEVPGVLASLEDALHTGDLSMDKVNESVLRIAAVKGKLPACGG